ncbi:MAG: PrgI family protein [Lachnospiraceae bacterium]|nr:PrgI family protein [Lachnospiraceae bacterium]
MANSYITIPRDLTKVKSKILFNLTKRQLICFSVAVMIGLPTFFLVRSAADTSTSVMSMIVVMMPMFFVAMYEKNGRPLEVYMGHFIEAVFIRPRKRPYKTDNYYSALHRCAEAEKEVEKIVQASMDEKKRKNKI